jgi:hypothetical protein
MTIDRRGGTSPEGVQVMTGFELRESDANWALCNLIRFSICPRWQ